MLSFFRSIFSSYGVTICLIAIAYALVIVPYREDQVRDPCHMLRKQQFTLFSKRVVTPKGVIAATVKVAGGKIVSVTKRLSPPKASEKTGELIDLGSLVLSPGLVDIHVHMNEPGRVHWEGAETATMAAAAGGVTTLVDMPLNSFPTTTDFESFALKLKATRGQLSVDVGFWAGLVPENAKNITKIEQLMEAGALGLKSFMCPSGIDDFPQTNATHFEAALPVLARYGRPLLVHAEVPQPLEDESAPGDPTEHRTWMESRPPSWEQAAISTLASLALRTAAGGEYEGAKIHIVHLSDSHSLPLITTSKQRGSVLTVETCPHYLHFASEDVPRGGTLAKCAPPLRGQGNREELWGGLKGGEIDFLSSDHSPAPPDMKKLESGNFLEAWGGIAGLQFSLPATWTNGKARNVSLSDLANWWSLRPAELANLHQKGSIQPGKDADFVVWDPEASFVVDENFTIYHRHKLTPYSGSTFFGAVKRTYVRGALVYDGKSHGKSKCGNQILAEA